MVKIVVLLGVTTKVYSFILFTTELAVPVLYIKTKILI